MSSFCYEMGYLRERECVCGLGLEAAKMTFLQKNSLLYPKSRCSEGTFATRVKPMRLPITIFHCSEGHFAEVSRLWNLEIFEFLLHQKFSS